MITVRSDVGWNTVKIYINDVLHIKFKKEDLISIQGWIEGYESDSTYHIQYVFKNKKMRSEYWDLEHWKAILGELDKLELF